MDTKPGNPKAVKMEQNDVKINWEILQDNCKFTLDIHIVTNSFAPLLRSDLQKIQNITLKYILDDNNLCRATFSKQ